MRYRITLIVILLITTSLIQSCNIHPACAAYALSTEQELPINADV